MNTTQHHSSHRHGFTLVELLVVIAIIAALTAIAFPVISSFRYNARVTKSVTNMKQVGIANLYYSEDNHGRVNGIGKKLHPQSGRTRPENFPWRVAAYLTDDYTGGNGHLTWDDVVRVWEPLHHPHIPAQHAWGPDSYRLTVSVNKEFAIGVVRPGQQPGDPRDFPRENQYDAARTIHSVSGTWTFTADQVADPAYLELPESGSRGGPYFTKKKQLPCLFLDGSVRLEKFPIAADLVDPSKQP